MRILLLLFILLMSLNSTAADYGYLKITVLAINPEHKTQVNLNLNNHTVTSFSHATNQSVVIAITSAVLSNGNSTPLNSDYRNLQKGCEFDFRIEYSLNQNFWVNIGTYHAPTSSVQTNLPIGICNGEVCSSNLEIQRQLDQNEEAIWKKNGEIIKEKVEAAIQEQRDKLDAIQSELYADEVLQQEDSRLTNELNRNINELDQLRTNQNYIQTPNLTLDNVVDNALKNSSLENLISSTAQQQNFLENCLKSDRTTQYVCKTYGSLGWIGAAAESIAIGLSENPELASEQLKSRILDPNVNATLKSDLEQTTEIRMRVQTALEIKRSREDWAKIAVVSRTGIAFSPLNDIVDFCEAASGRMMCLPNGEELSNTQRFLAAMGMIVGNRMLWENISDEVKLSTFSEFSEGLSKPNTNILAKDLNKVITRDAEEVNKIVYGDYIPPFKTNTRVFEFTTHTEINGQFSRVSQNKDTIVGSWLLEKKSIIGLTPEQIKDKYALEKIPQFISDVNIPSGFTMRKGIVNPIFGSSGDTFAIQYVIDRTNVPSDFNFSSIFSNTRKIP